MLYLLLCLMFLPHVYGGTSCPERADIYPCLCIDKSIGKTKYETMVVCHRLDTGTTLLSIEPALAKMDIDRFLLYDSFWSNRRRSNGEATVPSNILSNFRIEEIEMVDTVISSFACPKEYICRTSVLKKYASINTTLPEGPTCSNGIFRISSWISCPSIVEEIVIEKGFPRSLNTIKPDFFPDPMPQLKTLRLTRNQISRIEMGSINSSKFPNLTTLDLRFNNLRDAKGIFGSQMKLKHLDLSYNALRTVPDFMYLPDLESLNLRKNNIMAVLPNEWQNLPKGLRHVDLENNNLNCGCGSQDINSHFHVNANLLGECNEPPRLKGKKLRKAARYLSERCDKEGNIGTKRKKSASS